MPARYNGRTRRSLLIRSARSYRKELRYPYRPLPHTIRQLSEDFGETYFFPVNAFVFVVCTLALLLAKVNSIFEDFFTFGKVGGICAGMDVLLEDMH